MYKRQLVICLFMIRFSHQISKHYKYANLLLKMYLIGFISYVVLTPVSYTHLDVYKRQACGCGTDGR